MARWSYPPKLVQDVVSEAIEQERLEEWIMGEVARGAAAAGLYPPDAANLARYEATKK